MKDRARLISLGVENGITDLSDIKNSYNEYRANNKFEFGSFLGNAVKNTVSNIAKNSDKMIIRDRQEKYIKKMQAIGLTASPEELEKISKMPISEGPKDAIEEAFSQYTTSPYDTYENAMQYAEENGYLDYLISQGRRVQKERVIAARNEDPKLTNRRHISLADTYSTATAGSKYDLSSISYNPDIIDAIASNLPAGMDIYKALALPVQETHLGQGANGTNLHPDQGIIRSLINNHNYELNLAYFSDAATYVRRAYARAYPRKANEELSKYIARREKAIKTMYDTEAFKEQYPDLYRTANNLAKAEYSEQRWNKSNEEVTPTESYLSHALKKYNSGTYNPNNSEAYNAATIRYIMELKKSKALQEYLRSKGYIKSHGGNLYSEGGPMEEMVPPEVKAALAIDYNNPTLTSEAGRQTYDRYIEEGPSKSTPNLDVGEPFRRVVSGASAVGSALNTAAAITAATGVGVPASLPMSVAGTILQVPDLVVDSIDLLVDLVKPAGTKPADMVDRNDVSNMLDLSADLIKDAPSTAAQFFPGKNGKMIKIPGTIGKQLGLIDGILDGYYAITGNKLTEIPSLGEGYGEPSTYTGYTEIVDNPYFPVTPYKERTRRTFRLNPKPLGPPTEQEMMNRVLDFNLSQ